MAFVGSAYGPPWTGIQGTGVTATGVDLRGSPHTYVVAVDPKVIPLGTKLRAWPNPFGDPNIVFTAADTGGAITGNRIDFYDWRGRQSQNAFGMVQGVNVSPVTTNATKYVFPLGSVAYTPGGTSGFGGPVDQGVDIETGLAGVGKPILAIGDAHYVGTFPDPGGFGPTEAVYRLDSPPPDALSPFIYIGHARALPTLEKGAAILAGQPVATIQGGPGYGGSLGHIEIGYGSPGAPAQPLGHAEAAATPNYHETGTQAGAEFRSWLARLQSQPADAAAAATAPSGFLGGLGGYILRITDPANVPGFGAAGGAVDATVSVGKFLGKLSDPQTWLRILEVVGGFVLAFAGLVLLARQIGLAPSVPAGPVGTVVAAAASG